MLTKSRTYSLADSIPYVVRLNQVGVVNDANLHIRDFLYSRDIVTAVCSSVSGVFALKCLHYNRLLEIHFRCSLSIHSSTLDSHSESVTWSKLK